MVAKAISEQQDNMQQLVEALETHKSTETEQHNLAVGKHRARIVELLNTWKEQLSLMIRSAELDEIVATIENDDEFRAIIDHCTSVKEKYNSLGKQRTHYKIHLNPKSLENGVTTSRKASKQEIAKNKKLLDEKMQPVIEAIECCLQSNEYTQKKCGWCPKDMR